MAVGKFLKSLGSVGMSAGVSAGSSLGSGLMSAIFGGLANKRAKKLYKYQKQQDLAYQKDLSEYLTTNQSSWEKQSLQNAGLSTAGMNGQPTLAGTSLGSGNLQSQPIEVPDMDIAGVAASLADAKRADSQAALLDKQAKWYDDIVSKDLALKDSQIGVNATTIDMQTSLTSKYDQETLNAKADYKRIQVVADMTSDLLKAQLRNSDANTRKISLEAETIAKELPYKVPQLEWQLRLYADQHNLNTVQAASLRAGISTMMAQAQLYGEQALDIRQMRPYEVKKLVQDTAYTQQMITNAKTDRQMTMARMEYQKLENKYYVRNMRWNHAAQTFGMFRDLGIGAGSLMSGAGSLMTGGSNMLQGMSSAGSNMIGAAIATGAL